jgi:hypothetical protein
MTVRTSFRAVIFVVFLHGIIGGNHAQAGLTGTFHFGNGSHKNLPLSVLYLL